MTRLTKGQEKDKAAAPIHDAAVALAKAKALVRRRQERLEDAISNAVTTAPASPIWYTKPGVLTPEEAGGFADLSALGVHKVMERQRARAAAKANRAKRSKGKLSAKARRREAQRVAEDAQAPRF